jgi:DNA-binding NarL/FixJ family response regulator
VGLAANEPGSRPLRVLVIDDHPVVREGVKTMLGGATDLVVVGEAASARDAIKAAEQLAPDVVLLDLDLGAEDALPHLPAIRGAAPAARLIVLTGIRERARHEAALLAGARGLVMKHCPAVVLLEAIRKVCAGELWFERALLEAVLVPLLHGRNGAPDPAATRLALLTHREREVAKLIGEGLRNEEIGRRLFISEKTVRNHLSSVFEKLGVSDRLELMAYAFRHGLSNPRG